MPAHPTSTYYWPRSFLNLRHWKSATYSHYYFFTLCAAVLFFFSWYSFPWKRFSSLDFEFILDLRTSVSISPFPPYSSSFTHLSLPAAPLTPPAWPSFLLRVQQLVSHRCIELTRSTPPIHSFSPPAVTAALPQFPYPSSVVPYSLHLCTV